MDVTRKENAFSIIVPVFNCQDTIRRCVDSILSQSIFDTIPETKIEIVLVDNGSTDRSIEVIKELIKQYPDKLVLKNSKKKGPSSARNVGLDYVTGEIVGFCDADDYYEKNALLSVHRLFAAHEDASLIVTGFNRVIGNEKVACSVRKQKVSFSKLIEKILIDDNVMGAVWNKFYKLDIVSKTRFNENLSHSEDTHFNINVLNSNNTCVAIVDDTITYNYVKNTSSLTNNHKTLFDKNNNNKYLVSLDSIYNEFALQNRDVGYINVAKAKIAYTAIFYKDIDKVKKEKMLLELKRSKKYLLSYALRKMDTKYLILYLKSTVVIHKFGGRI